MNRLIKREWLKPFRQQTGGGVLGRESRQI